MGRCRDLSQPADKLPSNITCPSQQEHCLCRTWEHQGLGTTDAGLCPSGPRREDLFAPESVKEHVCREAEPGRQVPGQPRAGVLRSRGWRHLDTPAGAEAHSHSLGTPSWYKQLGAILQGGPGLDTNTEPHAHSMLGAPLCVPCWLPRVVAALSSHMSCHSESLEAGAAAPWDWPDPC